MAQKEIFIETLEKLIIDAKHNINILMNGYLKINKNQPPIEPKKITPNIIEDETTEAMSKTKKDMSMRKINIDTDSDSDTDSDTRDNISDLEIDDVEKIAPTNKPNKLPKPKQRTKNN